MKKNLMNTTVKDIAYLVNPSCLKASSHTPLEKLAEQICSSDRYKVYLEDEEGRVCGGDSGETHCHEGAGALDAGVRQG